MSYPATPPTDAASQLPLKEGSSGWPTFAVQGALGTAGYSASQDGVFGPKTTTAVKGFQRDHQLAVDGKVGPATQHQLATVICAAVQKSKPAFPKGLAMGLAQGEGGMNLAAVNWTVDGGVDCGLWQWRVEGPPYSLDGLREAFSPQRAGLMAAQAFLDRRAGFLGRSWVGASKERAGRCALLAHNWPAGAASQARYGWVPSPTSVASWVPLGVRFPDGAYVTTRQQWAEFYALGGPHGSGVIASSVKDWG